MPNIRIQTPFTPQDARRLRAGDSCLISGVIYTARDAAHKRLCELLEQGKGNRVVGIQNNRIVDYDINEALDMVKDIDEYLYKVAYEISI